MVSFFQKHEPIKYFKTYLCFAHQHDLVKQEYVSANRYWIKGLPFNTFRDQNEVDLTTTVQRVSFKDTQVIENGHQRWKTSLIDWKFLQWALISGQSNCPFFLFVNDSKIESFHFILELFRYYFIERHYFILMLRVHLAIPSLSCSMCCGFMPSICPYNIQCQSN